MRRRTGLGLTAAFLVSACVFDIPGVVGSDGGQDSAPADAAADVCTSLDASCMPAVPAGWTPVVVPTGGCAQGYVASNLATNPRLDDAGCPCSCMVTGSYDCSLATFTLTTGAICGSTMPTVPVDACQVLTTSHFGFSADPVAGGSPSCTTPSPSPKADTDPVVACAPSTCDLDFCGAAGQKCIAMSGDTTCPPGFPTKIAAGTGATATCPSCGCNLGPAPTCPGLLLGYTGTTCAASAGFTGSAGMCVAAAANSLKFTTNGDAGPTTCSTTMTGTGSASLTGPTTLCCVN